LFQQKDRLRIIIAPSAIAGVRFENGIEVIQVPANHAA
jgi:hypothetical protein